MRRKFQAFKRPVSLFLASILLVGTVLGGFGAPVQAAVSNDNIVISQVYGGGGNGGAPIKQDFIELYNPTDSPISLAGWSVQYTSATGAFTTNIHNLSGTIAAKGYFLIQEAAGASTTAADLESPDAIGTLSMGGTAGKVRLLNASSAVVDLVAYGSTATGGEGAPTGDLGAALAAIRKALNPGDRALDTDNNNADFTVAAPSPRNSSYGAVASVSASPAGGEVPAGTYVTLSTATVGYSVYYSVYSPDAPVAPENFTAYASPIEVTAPMTLHAYVKNTEGTISGLTEFSYTLANLTPVAIADVRSAAVGSKVVTQGTVSHRTESGGKVNLFVQDADSAVVVRGTDSGAQPGDDVEVYGQTSLYNGLLQLDTDLVTGGYVTINGQSGIPAPTVITSTSFGTSDALRNQSEGRLVQINDVTIKRAASGVFYATDAASSQEIAIYSSDTAFALNKTFEQVTGVMTYYTGVGLELVPRSSSDIVERKLSVIASIPSGGIATGGTVELSTLMSGGVIHFTTDGSTPTSASPVYSAPITINADTTIKAIVIAGADTSSVYTFEYTVLQNTDGIKIHTIQGKTHRSIYENVAVTNVSGIVTSASTNSFYMQEPDSSMDNDPATSEAIQVYKAAHGAQVGDAVTVDGTVVEYGTSPALTVTQITATNVTRGLPSQPLPAPIVLGTNGRIVPTAIDTDSFGAFNPDGDAIDFFESLEGMRIQLNDALITGPYANSVTPVTFDNGANNPIKTDAGGIVLTGDGVLPFESSLNPQKMYIAAKPAGQDIKTGDQFNAPITGVLNYTSNLFKLIPDGALPAITYSSRTQGVATTVAADDKLTIATFNVENFSSSQTTKAAKIGGIIVDNLKKPDIIGLMEVQDNNGETNNGVTDASQSFQTLINAVVAKGGPTYAYTDIAPVDGMDGGAPGGNIRVGFLYNTARVTLAAGTKGDSTTAVQVKGDGTLSVNPGRISPTDTAFNASRKPLAAEFNFQGKRVVVVANHFNSKGGDGIPWGTIQPVIRSSETQRALQAGIVNSFVSQLVASDPNVNVAVLGDLNDFQFSKTLDILKKDVLTNLVDEMPEKDRYSYIYDGNSQTLDHILVNDALTDYSAIEVVHVNADFTDSMGRVSDHDPLLAQLDLGSKPVVGNDNFSLRVLHTNDTHAHLDNMARRVTAINSLRDDNTLLLDAGDVFSGTLYFNQFHGLADLWFMNKLKYDAMTFGNHEFDKDAATLAAFINGAEFPFVAANVNFSGEAELGSKFVNSIPQVDGAANDATIYPAIIKEVDGEKVGIFGLTTPDTALLASPGKVVFNDVKASAEATVAQLESLGINKIIALSHIGYTEDQKLAAEVDGIDIIVGGHSHTQLNEPFVYRKNLNADPTLIVQTGEYGVNLGQLDVKFNAAGKLTSWDGKLVNVDQQVNSQYVFAADPTAAAKVAEFNAPLTELKKTVVGKTDVALDGLRKNVRRQETNLGNLIADGMLDKVKNSPLIDKTGIAGYVTIQNAGGIRDSIPAGDITLGHLLTVMPFGNNLTALKMTGREIIAALENGVSGSTPVSEEGRFPQVAGMKFYYDMTKQPEIYNSVLGQITTSGERILKVQVLNDKGKYVDIDEDAYYIVATNSFMANGGDFYLSMKAAKDAGRFYELNFVDYEVFNEYLSKVGTVNIGVEGRITDVQNAFDLRVLHTNDTHAHLDNAPRRVNAATSLKSEKENALLLDAGDVFSGTLYFNQFKGLADLWFMNEMKYDAMTFGNHEFDKDAATLAAFIRGANFPFVSSNVNFSGEAELDALFNDDIVYSSSSDDNKAEIHKAIIKQFGGEEVGIVGLTTPDTALLASPGQVRFEDYVDSTRSTVAALEQKGVNKIIVLSHLGYGEDLKLAAAVEGIDIIVGGHSHTQLNEPTVYKKTAEAASTLIVQTGEYGVYLGKLDAIFDAQGELVVWNGELVNVDEKIGSNYKFTALPEHTAKLEGFKAPIAELQKTVVGKSNVALDGLRKNVRRQETNLGNLIADGMLDKVKNSPLIDKSGIAGFVTIQNAGGIRDSIPAGDITLGHLLTVMPFGNNLTALKMTGAEITAALENGVSGSTPTTEEGRFPQVAGMRYTFDSTKKPEIYNSVTGVVTQQGERIVKVEVLNEQGEYVALDPNAYYIVATNSFMANGGDFYLSMKAAKDAGRFYELNFVDYEVFNEYLAKIGTVDIGIQGRITDLLGSGNPGTGTPGTSNPGTSTPSPSPTPSVSPSPSPEPSPTPTSAPLKDVTGHWAEQSIKQAVEQGIVKGFTDGTFRPEANATRAEFVTMVSRAFKLGDATSVPNFRDADTIPVWARSFVAQLSEAGLISGYADNTFRPSNPLTRIEMTAIMVRALGLPIDTAATVVFADASEIPAWAVPYVAAAAKAGIVQGANNRFNPSANATRAEVVTLLLNATKYAEASK
ncbi:5'-nucleotidase C-terminal domain-containing protein [Paenibacillus sp. KS-LC4]|uniref:5'-nucleotidase C-terminal domain-containing protein n=1 Tax=Paenibacillus sp. KS-LC4 TaxID=2979727 RepID=UPI0030D2474C